MMKLASKETYAILSLIYIYYINKKNEGYWIRLLDIALTLKVSVSYLEQIFSILKEQGLVKGKKGRKGGYKLNKNISEIKISDVFKLFNQKITFKTETEKAILTFFDIQTKKFFSKYHIGDICNYIENLR